MHKYIERNLSKKLKSIADKIPVISLTGPRQSGKTTLVRHIFQNYNYVSLDNPDTLDFALADPKGFLNTYGDKLILDEVQYSPNLFHYIKTNVDNLKNKYSYIITGSQNFLLNSEISESLAGRVIIFNLLPLSIDELSKTNYKFSGLSDIIVKGFYPRIYNADLRAADWYPSYIQTYLERDVRQIINVGDINSYRNFIRVCAGRCGQIINLSSIGNDIGVSYQTIKKWLSILEQSYIIFLLQPYYKNFNKRIIKSPKIYFYDTGLACSLLGINSPETFETHYLKGNLFESFVISELVKRKFNSASNEEFYFWRDSNGNEVDCLIETGQKLKAIEIKVGQTIKSEFFNNLYLWNNLNKEKNKDLNLIYGGTENQKRKSVKIFGWKNFPHSV